MGILDFLTMSSQERAKAREATVLNMARQEAILAGLRSGAVPSMVQERLQATKDGRSPWTATATPAEMLVLKRHGIRPICAVSATCWMHYGRSWTRGHSQGWHQALDRLRAEAASAGANVVLDVKMHTAHLDGENNMDFSLTGTAVQVRSIKTATPLIATVSAVEFIRLIDARAVPTGIAIGADYEWFTDRSDQAMRWRWGNVESRFLTDAWYRVRTAAMRELRASAAAQGNGALAHVNFSQIFDFERENPNETRYFDYLLRHIVVATVVNVDTVDKPSADIRLVVDVGDDKRLNTGGHQHTAYSMNDRKGPI